MSDPSLALQGADIQALRATCWTGGMLSALSSRRARRPLPVAPRPSVRRSGRSECAGGRSGLGLAGGGGPDRLPRVGA